MEDKKVQEEKSTEKKLTEKKLTEEEVDAKVEQAKQDIRSRMAKQIRVIQGGLTSAQLDEYRVKKTRARKRNRMQKASRKRNR